MSSEENESNIAKKDNKSINSPKKTSKDNLVIEVSEFKNSEEIINENISEEENEFVVDLGNTTPVKEVTTFKLNEIKEEKLNEYLESNENNFEKNPEFPKIAKLNLIGEFGSGSENRPEQQHENLFTLDKIFDDEEEENFKKRYRKSILSHGTHDLNKFTNDQKQIDQTNINNIVNRENLSKTSNQNQELVWDSANSENDLNKNNFNNPLNKELIEKEIYEVCKDNSEEKANAEINIENSISSQEIHIQSKIPILNKLINSKENIIVNEPNKKNDQESNEPCQTNIINNLTLQSNKIIRISNGDIEPKLIFEKLHNTNLDAKHQFRICIVGDSNIGKTSLLLRYSDNTFKSTMTNTIGVDFRVLMLKYNDINIKLQIWDTAGQERFKSISVNYFKSANGFIFVYDIANRITFENLNNWFEIVSQHNKNSICNFVIGNKCDLENRRQVSIEEGRDLAFSKKFNFMETSAKSAKNVDMAFEIFTMKLMEFFNIDDASEYIKDENLSNYSIEDGRRFKIDEEEKKNKKKREKKGCKC